MKAEDADFLDGFLRKSVGAQYVIPVYQRNYNWKKDDQVRQLLDDIDTLLARREQKHFFGTLVFFITKDSLNGQERSIVDGQQRLTTIMLLLYAIRSLARQNGEQGVVQALTTNYLENVNSDLRYKLRLKPSVSDDGDYREIAAGGECAGSRSNVAQAYRACREWAEKWLATEKANGRRYTYDDLVNAVKRLQIVAIILERDKGDKPQQVFESINSTGMELTGADLIRNFILMVNDSEKQERLYLQYWKKLEDLFEEPRFQEAFLRLYLANRQMSLTARRNLYAGFKQWWKEQRKKRSEEELLSGILNYARHYVRLYYYSESDSLGEALDDYRRLQSDMPAPFMMEVLELLRTRKITLDDARKVLELINVYLIRRYLTNLDTSDITRFFPAYLRLVREQAVKHGYKHFYELCRDTLIRSTRQKNSFVPDDTDVRNYLRTANAYNLKNMRFILEKLEMRESNVRFVPQTMSIEHIMPQTRGREWAEARGASNEQYVSYVNRLGNLTLAAKADNSVMGNQSFAAKKEILRRSSHIKMNEDILRLSRWDFAAIDARTERMIDEILQAFPVAVDNYVEQTDDFDSYADYLDRKDETAEREKNVLLSGDAEAPKKQTAESEGAKVERKRHRSANSHRTTVKKELSAAENLPKQNLQAEKPKAAKMPKPKEKDAHKPTAAPEKKSRVSGAVKKSAESEAKTAAKKRRSQFARNEIMDKDKKEKAVEEKRPRTARIYGGGRTQHRSPLVEEIKRPKSRTRWSVKN